MKSSTEKHSTLFQNGYLIFLSILTIEFLQLLYIIFSQRLVVHDTFFRFYMQYYFLNNVVFHNEIPFWIPYLTHGTLTTPWLGLVGVHGILNNVLLWSGSALKDLNFLPIFYVGVYFDKIVLLLGTWLLSNRLYKSYIVSAFVTTSLLGSSVWANQIHLNFHFYYALPLILYLYHEFISTRRWRYFFLASNLFLLQSIDKLFYFIPVISLSLFIYFFFYIMLNRTEVFHSFNKLKFNKYSILTFLSILGCLGLVYTIVSAGMNGQIIKMIFQRNLDGSVPLQTFLNYGKDTGLSNWLELFLGISIKRDTTVYYGLLGPIMALFACCFQLNRRSLPFLITIIILTFFSLGTFVSTFFYHTWPTMKYYRHIYQTTPIIKMYLCFLSGFGFLALVNFITATIKTRLQSGWLLLCALTAIVFGFFCVSNAHNAAFLIKLIMPLTYDATAEQLVANKDMFSSLVFIFSIKLIVFGLLLLLSFFVKNTNRQTLLIACIIFIHIVDIYSYSLKQFNTRTSKLTSHQMDITRFKEMPYHPQRSPQFLPESARPKILTSFLLEKSKFSWNIQAFLFHEPIKTQLRTDHWLQPYDHYLKAYWKQELNDASVKPLGLDKFSLGFPSQNIAAAKLSGLTEHKIQFFKYAYRLNNERDIAGALSNSDHQGDMIFVEPNNNKMTDTDRLIEWTPSNPLNKNDRLPISYKVSNFSSNQITIETINPYPHYIWLYYSDTWHPNWQVMVNNLKSTVFKANIAYKAVPIPPGDNTIAFKFESKLLSVLTLWLGINSLFWVLCIVFYFRPDGIRIKE